METWQVVFITLYGGVLAWLVITQVQHTKKLAVIESVLEGLVSRVDLFLKTEVDTLKELTRVSLERRRKT